MAVASYHSCCHPRQPLVQPPHGDLTIRLKVRRTTRTACTLGLECGARHGAGESRLLPTPPFKDSVKNAFAVVPEDGDVQVEHGVKLRIECTVVRPNAAICLVADAR